MIISPPPAWTPPCPLDEQNQLRLRTILSALRDVLDTLGETRPAIAQSLRMSLYAQITNLQIDCGVESPVEIRP